MLVIIWKAGLEIRLSPAPAVRIKRNFRCRKDSNFQHVSNISTHMIHCPLSLRSNSRLIPTSVSQFLSISEPLRNLWKIRVWNQEPSRKAVSMRMIAIRVWQLNWWICSNLVRNKSEIAKKSLSSGNRRMLGRSLRIVRRTWNLHSSEATRVTKIIIRWQGVNNNEDKKR